MVAAAAAGVAVAVAVVAVKHFFYHEDTKIRKILCVFVINQVNYDL